MYSEAFDVVNNIVAKNMDVENQSGMFRTLHNSEMFQEVESLKAQMGGGSNLPYFFSTGSDSQGSQNTTGLSIITNPENLFDGQTNTQASMALLSPNNTWSVLILDVSTNYLSGTLVSAGTVFMGVVNGTLLTQGNYVMEDGEFTTLTKSGYYSDLSGQSLIKDNAIARNANLVISDSILMKYQLVGSTRVLSIGTKYAKLRNMTLTQVPQKFVFAVKNGTLNITKNTPSLSYLSEQSIDIDATDLVVRVGLNTINENGAIAFNLTNQGDFFYGIADSSLYLGISFSDQQIGGLTTQTGYMVAMKGGQSAIGNGTTSNQITSFAVLSSYVIRFEKRQVSEFVQHGVFQLGNGTYDYSSGFFDPSTTSYTNNGTYRGFVIGGGGLSTLTYTNFFQTWGSLTFNTSSHSLTYGLMGRNYSLTKEVGANTAHYFEALLSNYAPARGYMLAFQKNQSENVFFGVVDSSVTNNAVLSGAPVPLMHMSIDGTGNVYGNGNLIGTSPTYNTSPSLIFFSYTTVGANITLRMGRSSTNYIQYLTTISSGVRLVVWVVGGSSSISTVYTTIQVNTTNILL